MSTTEKAPSRQAPPEAKTKAKKRPGDIAFSGASLGAGIIILLVLAATAVFLIVQSVPAFTSDPEKNTILRGESFWSYALPLLFGTIWSSLIALVIATPIAIGIALFISHYAPRRLASVLGYVIDLLAAVPSVVFGLWGMQFFAHFLQPFYATLTDTVGTWPVLSWFLSGPVSPSGRTLMTASLVLAVMILPIMTAISREVFLQTPKLHEEAALALGATRWEMISMDGGHDGALGLADHRLPAAAVGQPALDRREHRTGLPRGAWLGHQHSYRHRSGAVHRDVPRERRRAMDREPPCRVLGSQLI
jgi:phosphate transport system permease protein